MIRAYCYSRWGLDDIQVGLGLEHIVAQVALGLEHIVAQVGVRIRAYCYSSWGWD